MSDRTPAIDIVVSAGVGALLGAVLALYFLLGV